MEAIKQRFAALVKRENALRFGGFQTKSGRASPYFFNSGGFFSGEATLELAHCYAAVIAERLSGARNPLRLFGPAYKGIPLAVMTAAALKAEHDIAATFTFDRKEHKDHGEGGNLVGYQLQRGDQVILVEDVLTGGTSVRNTLTLLRPLGVTCTDLVVGVDRQERGAGTLAASTEIAKEFGIRTHAIVTIRELLAHTPDVTEDQTKAVEKYLSEYGA